MPLDLGNVAGMRTKFQLYTVPGQVYYNSTRKLVLQGVDGVIFVADSDPEKMDENIKSVLEPDATSPGSGKDVRELPHVIQVAEQARLAERDADGRDGQAAQQVRRADVRGRGLHR